MSQSSTEALRGAELKKMYEQINDLLVSNQVTHYEVATVAARLAGQVLVEVGESWKYALRFIIKAALDHRFRVKSGDKLQ